MKKNSTVTSKLLEKIGFFIVLIGIWQTIYYIGVDVLHIWKSYAMPSPQGVFKKFVFVFSNEEIYFALVSSLQRVFIGYLLSVFIGIIIGFIITKVEVISRNIKPIILGLQTLPSICWVPFAILWFGLDQNAVLFVIVIGSTFSIAMSVESSIYNVEPIYIRAAKTMGVSQRQLYTKVIFPAALPMMLSGLKQGWSFAWRALMSGEMMISMIGLGQVLDAARNMRNDINEVLVVMIVIIILGTFIDLFVFQGIEKRVLEHRGYNRDKDNQ